MVHCWTGEREWIEERYGYLSREYLEYVAAIEDGKMSATCLLEDGHDGPHEFTPDDQITVRFLP